VDEPTEVWVSEEALDGEGLLGLGQQLFAHITGTLFAAGFVPFHELPVGTVRKLGAATGSAS
jgi:hypothetical protein